MVTYKKYLLFSCILLANFTSFLLAEAVGEYLFLEQYETIDTSLSGVQRLEKLIELLGHIVAHSSGFAEKKLLFDTIQTALIQHILEAAALHLPQDMIRLENVKKRLSKLKNEFAKQTGKSTGAIAFIRRHAGKIVMTAAVIITLLYSQKYFFKQNHQKTPHTFPTGNIIQDFGIIRTWSQTELVRHFKANKTADMSEHIVLLNKNCKRLYS